MDGQLNWQVFTHCTIGRATKLSVVQLEICGLAQEEDRLSAESLPISDMDKCAQPIIPL